MVCEKSEIFARKSTLFWKRIGKYFRIARLKKGLKVNKVTNIWIFADLVIFKDKLKKKEPNSRLL